MSKPVLLLATGQNGGLNFDEALRNMR